MQCINCLRFLRVEPIDSGEEYCYPEVEPKFDKDQLAALFGKCPLPGSRETGASQQPTSDPMYCPPPVMDPRDIPRKSPRQDRPALPSPQPGPGMGFSYLGGNRMSVGSPSLRPMRQPSPGSSPDFNRKVSPVVPSRHGKPLAPPKPLPRPPPLTKHATAPVLMYTPPTLNSDGMLPVHDYFWLNVSGSKDKQINVHCIRKLATGSTCTCNIWWYSSKDSHICYSCTCSSSHQTVLTF